MEPAQAFRKGNDTELLTAEIVNALPHRIAVLDERGTIVHASPAWERAARDGADPLLKGMLYGANYLSACASRAGDAGLDGSELSQRLRAVARGDLEGFEIEYEFPADSGPKASSLHAGRLNGGGREALILSHQDGPVRSAWELGRIADANCMPAAAYVLGAGPLSESSPDVFSRLVRDYGDLLDGAVKRRVYKIEEQVNGGTQLLARRFCAAEAGPRDVVEVHKAALRDRAPSRGLQMIRAYAEESRILLLEVMGYLVSSYRSRASGPCLKCQDQER